MLQRSERLWQLVERPKLSNIVAVYNCAPELMFQDTVRLRALQSTFSMTFSGTHGTDGKKKVEILSMDYQGTEIINGCKPVSQRLCILEKEAKDARLWCHQSYRLRIFINT